MIFLKIKALSLGCHVYTTRISISELHRQPVRGVFNDKIPNILQLTPPMQIFLNQLFDIFDKLEFVGKVVHMTKLPVKDIFSTEDQKLAQQILSDVEFMQNKEVQRFLASHIMENNLISFADGPNGIVNKLEYVSNLRQKYKVKKSTHFTKWVDLSRDPAKKVATIKNQQIFMPFPSMFNDRFDCQLHLSPQDISDIAGGNEHNIAQLRHVLKILDYSLKICSFSLHDPMVPSSNHMWGLYGNNGTGIAVVYSLVDFMQFYLLAIQKNELTLLVNAVHYDDEYSPLALAQKHLIKEYLQTHGTVAALRGFSVPFVLTKTKQWEHEHELRVWKVDINWSSEFYNTNLNLPINTESNTKFTEYISKQSFDHGVDFIQPTSIILGWGCDSKSTDVQDLIKFVQDSSNIKLIQLDKYINYAKNQFYTIDDELAPVAYSR